MSVICRIVGERYGVTATELLSDRRTQPVAAARQVAMRLTREFTELSFPQIGARFNRDHSTVVHAMQATEATMINDLREAVSETLGVAAAPEQPEAMDAAQARRATRHRSRTLAIARRR